MLDDRWQLISRNTDDLFGIIRGDQTWLSTVQLLTWTEETVYESCLFSSGNSEVVRRYYSKEAAIAGHNQLAKKFNLR